MKGPESNNGRVKIVNNDLVTSDSLVITKEIVTDLLALDKSWFLINSYHTEFIVEKSICKNKKETCQIELLPKNSLKLKCQERSNFSKRLSSPWQ